MVPPKFSHSTKPHCQSQTSDQPTPAIMQYVIQTFAYSAYEEKVAHVYVNRYFSMVMRFDASMDNHQKEQWVIELWLYLATTPIHKIFNKDLFEYITDFLPLESRATMACCCDAIQTMMKPKLMGQRVWLYNAWFHGEQCRKQEFGVIAGIKNGKYTLYLVSKHVSIVLHPMDWGNKWEWSGFKNLWIENKGESKFDVDLCLL